MLRGSSRCVIFSIMHYTLTECNMKPVVLYKLVESIVSQLQICHHPGTGEWYRGINVSCNDRLLVNMKDIKR